MFVFYPDPQEVTMEVGKGQTAEAAVAAATVSPPISVRLGKIPLLVYIPPN